MADYDEQGNLIFPSDPAEAAREDVNIPRTTAPGVIDDGVVADVVTITAPAHSIWPVLLLAGLVYWLLRDSGQYR